MQSSQLVVIKVLLTPNPLDSNQNFYAVQVSKPRKVMNCSKERFKQKMIGSSFCPSLIYALTQDAVLNAVTGGVK